MSWTEANPHSAALFYLETVLGVSRVLAPEVPQRAAEIGLSPSPVAVFVSEKERTSREALQLMAKMAQAMGLKEFYQVRDARELQAILQGQSSVRGLKCLVLLTDQDIETASSFGQWDRSGALPLVRSHNLAALLGPAEDPKLKVRKRETWQHLQMVMAELGVLKERKS